MQSTSEVISLSHPSITCQKVDYFFQNFYELMIATEFYIIFIQWRKVFSSRFGHIKHLKGRFKEIGSPYGILQY